MPGTGFPLRYKLTSFHLFDTVITDPTTANRRLTKPGCCRNPGSRAKEPMWCSPKLPGGLTSSHFYITGIEKYTLNPLSSLKGVKRGKTLGSEYSCILTSDELKAGFTLTLFEVQFVPPLDSPLAKSFDREDISLKVIFSDEKKRISARWEACDIGFFMVGMDI